MTGTWQSIQEKIREELAAGLDGAPDATCFECGQEEYEPHEPGCETGMQEEAAERYRCGDPDVLATFDAILNAA